MRATTTAAMAGMVMAFGAPAPARASDWGCEVLLCLSNPGGATQFPACVAPIRRLWRAIAEGDAFPRCSGGGVRSARLNPATATAGRSVTIRYSDGTTRTFSLADVETVADGEREGGR